MHALRVVTVSAVLVVFAGCSADPIVTAERVPAPIINGTPAPDDQGVVYVARIGGGGFGACTGSLLAPRVVLTAKHCVVNLPQEDLAPECFGRALGYTVTPARTMFVGVGPSQGELSEVESAEEIRLSGNSDLIVGDDIALLILRRPVTSTTPLPFARTIPEMGETVRLVGYGIRDITGRGPSGVRYQTEAEVIARDICTRETEFEIAGPSVCSGDSGGPAFNSAGEVAGITSRGGPDRSGNRCGGSSTYVGTGAFVELIEQALRDTGVCVSEGAERCDGVDNDCDLEVDEDCDPLGSPCETGETCEGGRCEPVAMDGSGVCTQPCLPFEGAPIGDEPLGACPAGLYCRGVGCEGFCVRGQEGSGREDEACDDDIDCASLVCTDPGDGLRRCLFPCVGGAGQCSIDEVCSVGSAGGCGFCVHANETSNPNGIGEPCGNDSERCADELTCTIDGNQQYCTAACAGGGEPACASGYHCRAGQCLRGDPGADGAPCVGNEDCAGAVCARDADGDLFCTSACTTTCPAGLTCTPIGEVSVCVPNGSLDGEDCSADGECVSGTCGTFDGRSLCARPCGAGSACASGYDCVEDDANRPLCFIPPPTVHARGGGCSTAGPTGRGNLLVLLSFLSFVAFAVGRGRRNR